jgi:hypothetical protein
MRPSMSVTGVRSLRLNSMRDSQSSSTLGVELDRMQEPVWKGRREQAMKPCSTEADHPHPLRLRRDEQRAQYRLRV